MKAMILAAGLGTRLRPLTDHRPKALVEIAGRTLLEICLSRLRVFGVREAIVNVHHFAGMVVDYLQANQNFGMTVEISREERLLDTGGGLKKASWFFLEPGAAAPSAAANEPFILHNVDVLSTIDLAHMIRFHSERNALATLAVQDRPTSRPLLFNRQGLFQGRAAQRDRAREPASYAPAPGSEPLAFSGIHIVSPRIFAKLHEQGAFSIIDAYVRLAAEGEKILAFPADDSYWRDLGRPENILAATRDIESGTYSENKT